MSPILFAILTVAVTAACTFATRLVPFVLFGTRDKPPAIVRYLGEVLPPAVMAILIIYCLKDVDFSSANSILPQVISAAVVVLLHLWKRNNLLSIGAGTVCYMLLVQFVFI
ncbi:MAG: branched-chain amino acid transporter AzlD [Clostridiales bacterium]|jgi:branched-subunit amino acid transport protein AzlD|nr:branched-chain amino acid transporter AzlD [Clostridiales bacterium]